VCKLIYFFDQDIKSKDYSELLNYALNFCDTLTLRIRNYTKSLDGKKHLWGGEKQFAEWFDKVSDFTQNHFGEFILKIDYDAQYGAEKNGHENKIYTIAFNSESLKKLLVVNSLFGWNSGHTPEDLHLYTNGNCWLETISHEKICYIHDDSEELKALLREMNIKFWDGEDDED